MKTETILILAAVVGGAAYFMGFIPNTAPYTKKKAAAAAAPATQTQTTSTFETITGDIASVANAFDNLFS